MRLAERLLVAVRTDADHQIVAGDADEHPAAAQERESAEHLALFDVVVGAERETDPIRQFLVVGHLQLLDVAFQQPCQEMAAKGATSVARDRDVPGAQPRSRR